MNSDDISAALGRMYEQAAIGWLGVYGFDQMLEPFVFRFPPANIITSALQISYAITSRGSQWLIIARIQHNMLSKFLWPTPSCDELQSI